jgi:hypothetical protein
LSLLSTSLVISVSAALVAERNGVQFRSLASVAIFLGSYLPLAVILLVQDANYSLLESGLCWRLFSRNSSCVLPFAHPVFSLVAVVICLLCFCLTLVTLSDAKPKLPIRVTEAKYIPAELMSYTLPYVVSFMSIGYQETGKFVGFVIFLAWMFWITHKSGQILVNPLLAAFGWRLYEIKYCFLGTTAIHSGRALVRGAIESEHIYSHVAIQDIVVLKLPTPTNEG